MDGVGSGIGRLRTREATPLTRSVPPLTPKRTTRSITTMPVAPTTTSYSAMAQVKQGTGDHPLCGWCNTHLHPAGVMSISGDL